MDSRQDLADFLFGIGERKDSLKNRLCGHYIKFFDLERISSKNQKAHFIYMLIASCVFIGMLLVSFLTN